MKKNNIILIGFMGVGKGTVARAMVKEVGLKSHFREDGKEEAEMVGINSHFREDGKEEVCGNGTLVPYKNKAGTEVPVPNEENKEAGMVGINSHFREDGKEEVCGNGTLVPYKNKAGTEVPVPNEENKEAGMVGINSHFQYVIDTDDLIESMENRAIKKIFAVDGEAYFRNLEKKTALWLESSVENTIISTGGGFYRQENLKNIGTVIYLKSSFDGILKRIKKAPNAKNKLKKRPLLQNKKEAMKLYDTRVKEYERVADIIVDVENRDLKLIVKEILGQIK
ncbi:shikimate kinase [Aliarcobacter cryaerophilus]|uniref:shikimate kinase n=1 Tax=Aliarcobacter cryaerophilus TaxID=28198 RepID=UPI003DA35FC2